MNRTRRIGPKTLVPFRAIAADCVGSTSFDAQLNCRTLFHNSYCTFVTTLLRPFVGLFLNLPVRKRALCAEFAARFRLIELTFGRILTKRFGASKFQEVFARLLIGFPGRTPVSEAPISRACDLRAPHRLTRLAFKVHRGATTFPPANTFLVPTITDCYARAGRVTPSPLHLRRPN